MTIIQHDNMILAISPDAANHPFDKSVLPMASRCSGHLFDARALDARLEPAPLNSISIQQ